MPLFTWVNKYSVNNKQLDEQHKTLFEICNRLYDNCMIPDNTYQVDLIINDLYPIQVIISQQNSST